jgi:hypothetical protein
MQIRDLSKPITAKQLNESLAQKFGYKLNLEGFSDVQLEDVRNKLRTKLSQFELGESFDAVKEDPTYHKTKLMLDCINQEILEREMTPGEKTKEKNIKKKVDKSGMKKNMQKEYGAERGKQIYFAKIRKDAMKESVPTSWVDSAIARLELNETDLSELKAELVTRYNLSESRAQRVVFLSEGEAEKAAAIMTTKDMVEKITGWLEDVAQLKAEHLLELLDSIRENYGSDVAQQYQESVKPALEAIYTAIETSRQGLSNGLGALSGKGSEMMGAAPGGDMAGAMGEPGGPDMGGVPGGPGAMGEPGADAGAPDMGADMGGDMGGREKRESVDYSRKLGMMLAASKKK